MTDAASLAPQTGTAQQSALDPEIWFYPLENERARVELRHEGEVVCKLSGIAPLTMHIGKALVRMDGIDGLVTPPQHRGKGYAARLVRAVVERMSEGDAAMSMLYGITDFYPRFGYATAGPEQYLLLTQGATRYPMPDGWSTRRATSADLPDIHALYNASVVDVVGAEVRKPDGRVWTKMAADVADGETGGEAAPGECRLVVGPDGQIGGYVWLNPTFWYVGHFKKFNVTPETTVFAEVVAEEGAAAKAAIAACRAWDVELRGADAPAIPLLIPTAFQGPLVEHARFQSAQFVRVYARCGSSMARVLNTPRLIRSLLPELNVRWQHAHSAYQGVLDLQTEVGNVRIALGPQGVALVEDAAGETQESSRYEARIPQSMLARLVLGSFRPNELWGDLPHLGLPPLGAEARSILEILFPERQPHMNVPDRY